MIPNRKALVSIGLLVMVGSVQADPTVINTCPTVISSPGRYLLVADLICGAGTGILITSSDVTLALEGHRITAGVGANMGFSTAISNFSGVFPVASVTDVHILGPGLITNGGGNAFLDGVVLIGFVSDSEVSGITVLGSRSAGIGVDGAFGVNIGLTFTKNTLGRNGTGIIVTNLNASTISENDVSGNGVGISINNSDVGIAQPNLMVSHNILNGNTGDGVNIELPGPLVFSSVTVQNNVTSGNGGNGISAAPAQIINNKSLANGMFDLFDITPGTGCGAVWSGDT